MNPSSIILVLAGLVAGAGAFAADRRAPQRAMPHDRTVVYARVQHGPGVTQFLPVSGSAAGACAPVYSNGELTQIRSFGKSGEQIIYTVSPGQEGKFLYTRSLGPNGTLVYEPASLNPKPKPAAVGNVAADATPQPAQPATNYFSGATKAGGKPPPSVAELADASAATGRLAREWSEVFSSLSGAVENGK